jgi:hypothetical protein
MVWLRALMYQGVAEIAVTRPSEDREGDMQPEHEPVNERRADPGACRQTAMNDSSQAAPKPAGP